MTIVGCDPVNSHAPLDIETTKVSTNCINIGSSIYVLGHIEHNDRQKGLIMFGEGRISSEHEHVIEFYSLDGSVWAPGSAGFDEQGNFAFVVGDSFLPSKTKSKMSYMHNRYIPKKGSSKQPGILVQFIREWKQTMWDWGPGELSKERPSSTKHLPINISKEMNRHQSQSFDSVAKIVQELQNVCRGAQGKGVDLHVQRNQKEDLTNEKCGARVDSNYAPTGSQVEDFPSLGTFEYVGPKGCKHPLDGISGLATKELQINARKDFSRKNICTEVGSNAGLGSSMQDSISVDKISNFCPKGLSSTLGGIVDLATSELNTQKLVELEHGREEGLFTTIEEDSCSTSQNNFTTGFVKVKYFNKTTFSPDKMPAIDNPNQDPNGGSWYGWGKMASPSCPLSPEEKSKATCGHSSELQLESLNNPQSNSSKHEAPNEFNIKENPQNFGLQPLRSNLLTPIDILKTNTSPKTNFHVHAELGEVLSGCYPGSPHISPNQLGEDPHDSHSQSLISSLEISSPISHMERLPKPSLHQVVNYPPRELAFGEIHRSMTSPKSPNTAQVVPWKPPAGHGFGDHGSPLHNDHKITPLGFQRHKMPRLRKRGNDQKKATQVKEVQKVGKHFIRSFCFAFYKVFDHFLLLFA